MSIAVALGALTGCDKEQDKTPTPPSTATPAASPSPSLRPASGPSLNMSAKNGFTGITDVANASMTVTSNGLNLHAAVPDPQMLLPRVETSGSSKWTVRVVLSAPTPTKIQIFYSTTTHPQFDESHSITKPIQKGDNDVTMEITDGDFDGNIRLDPGDFEGDYLIKLIEVNPSH
jgi:hypothetical protein